MSEYRTGGFYDFLGEVMLAAGKAGYEQIKKSDNEKAKSTLEKGATALKDAAKVVADKAPETANAVVAQVKKEAVSAATTKIIIIVVVGYLLLKGKR